MIGLATETMGNYKCKDEVLKELNSPKFSHFDFYIANDLEGMEEAKEILLEANKSRNILNIDFPPTSAKFENNCITFVIKEDQELVATFSLIIDSQHGLPADKTFTDELTLLRKGDSYKISEICSLGVTKKCQRKKEIVFYIVILATLQNFKLNISECFITVKDKHVSFYKALNFEESSVKKISQRTYARVQLLSIKKELVCIPTKEKLFQKPTQPKPIKNLWGLLNRNISEKSIIGILGQLKTMELVKK